MARVQYTVEILLIDEEDDKRRPKPLATYTDVEASSLVHARMRGLHLYLADNPGADWTIVYGKARPV
jgi:hypothetical protein